MTATLRPQTGTAHVTPWVQLLLGVICMAAVANMQYGWTQFVDPIIARHHWERASIQFAFTIFVLIETWLVPVEGYLVDRLGPRAVIIGGAVLVAASWVLNSIADSLGLLYFAAALGGIGTGSVYGTCVGNALKWFPGRRGLAAGVTAAGYGAGAALTTLPIGNMIERSGYEHAFLVFGLLQGLIVLIMSWGLKVPPRELRASTAQNMQSARSFAPLQVLSSPVFWVLYAIFVLVAAPGLTLTASMAPIANDLHIGKVPVALFGFTLPALPALQYALVLNRTCDGIGRTIFGWISDRIGREQTMASAFILGAVALYTLAQHGSNPVLFVLVSALYFGAFGEIYSLLPATLGDTFGSQYAAANAGMLYTAKGVGSLLVSLATITAASRGWHTVLMIAMACNLLAAAVGILVLWPLRARHFAQLRTGQAGVAPAVASIAPAQEKRARRVADRSPTSTTPP